MANVIVVGSQWGDEGKGKFVDWLSERADVVVRFQGGHNAGHTLVIDEQVYKLALLPSGIVRGGKLSVIGNGVVFDPHFFLKEIELLRSQGVEISPENLCVAENAPLIMSFHRELDAAREDSNSGLKIGTTKRGIGPAYEDKVGRRAIRVIDLADPKTLPEKIERSLAYHNALRRGTGQTEISASAILDELLEVADDVLPYAKRVWDVLDQREKQGQRILFEGGQGALLDNDHGTYPFVTSSNVVAGQASAGSGMGPKSLNYILGITKAYTTRVGEGPFPAELNDEIGDHLGTVGKEWGVNTGRKRRCGWFDAVLVRQTATISGIDGLAFTKLDVLDGLEEIKVCVAYDLDGERIDFLPTSMEAQARVKPIYETIEGWSGSTAGARSWSDLPAQAVKYVRYVEELTQCPIALLSTGRDRLDTIMVTDPFQG